MAETSGNVNFVVEGLSAHRIRRAKPGANPQFNSEQEDKPVQINRRDYTRTAGSCIALQVGPNQTVVTTNDVIGAEFRARSAAVGTGSLLGVSSNPQATSDTSATGPVKAFEANLTVKGTRTSTEIAALRAFLDVDSTVTATNGKNVITVAAPNVSQWDNLFRIESANTTLVQAATNSVIDHAIPIKFGSTTYYIGLYDSLT